MIIEAISTAGDIAALVPAHVSALPDPDPIQPPGTEGLTAILGWARWVALAVCILGLFAAGALMAVSSRRGEGGEHVGKIGMSLAGVIVISAAVALVGFLAAT
ncbi:MAG TPA: hypothetical protein VK053_22730 [Jiangellaceae bacterium]|nr:hypothetical protein [Jiangellaceae bacterium]